MRLTVLGKEGIQASRFGRKAHPIQETKGRST